MRWSRADEPTLVTSGDGHIEEAGRLEKAGRLGDAEALYRAALLTEPSNPTALNLLGLLCYRGNRLHEAAALIERALAVHPCDAEAEGNLGAVLAAQGDLDGAIGHFRAAVELAPGDPAPWANLGAALQNADAFSDARAAILRAIELQPRYALAWQNLGLLEAALGANEAALACFTRAVELASDDPEAHVCRGLALLRAARFLEGWSEYEWRLDKRRARRLDRGFSAPKWCGAELAGKKVLIHAEQGFGDTLQFLRYLPMARARGGQILLELQPALRRLVSASDISRDVKIISRGEVLPAFDVYCPLSSLAGLFATEMATIPKTVPYLEADPTWPSGLPARAHRRRIGLVWAGNPDYVNDRNRSLPGSMLDALTELTQFEFVSLQKTPAARPQRLSLIDIAPNLDDFATTAAALKELDLLISVDTSVAHLAGALGRPGWVLLPFAADWRWLERREDSPWYPSLRLFRQTQAGDWQGVIERVRAELRILA